MDCNGFREKHVAYVDDVLSAMEMAEMQRHVRVCGRCARHDTSVRRGLMLARSIPQIEPSADFMARLQSRLREVEPDFDHPDPALAASRVSPGRTAIAAGLLVAAGVAAAMSMTRAPIEPIMLAPVVASRPAESPHPVASPAVVASLAAGIPVWPAVFMVSQPEGHMLEVELRDGQ